MSLRLDKGRGGQKGIVAHPWELFLFSEAVIALTNPLPSVNFNICLLIYIKVSAKIGAKALSDCKKLLSLHPIRPFMADLHVEY